MDAPAFAAAFEEVRPALRGYLTHLVLRPELAEELVQQTAVRALEALPRGPEVAAEVRPWCFRIASRLAIDHLRAHGTWREGLLLESRAVAEARPEFLSASLALRGNPELTAVAREHLLACLRCTLRALAPQRAAALLLREVQGFSVEEVAELLEARPAQAKAWIQEARATLTARYQQTCALVRKEGVCHQCVELDGFFNGEQRDPLAGTDRSLDARLALARAEGGRPAGPWHRMLLEVLEALA